jgi:methylated-DNA-[protein]-cysteine S-methyltransferase
MHYCYLAAPIGPLLIAGDDAAIHGVWFPRKGRPAAPERDWVEACRGPVAEACQQLNQYFAGRRTTFDLPLAPEGTAFQKSVWRCLQQIPYGATISYGELARRVGKPGAARAVGSANGRNRIPIVIPCHRVIAADGTLGGFGGGLGIKMALLELERKHSAATA